MTPEVHEADSIDRTESFAGLSFDWPSAAKYAGIGLLVGTLLGVVGVFTWGGGPENVNKPVLGIGAPALYCAVLGFGFGTTTRWRAQGGVEFWLAWAVSGGIAAIALVASGLIYPGGQWSDWSVTGFLIYWTAQGPATGMLVGWILRAWGIE